MSPRWPIALSLMLLASSGAALPLRGEDDFFGSKIEPILRERCFECHSHASGTMKGGLTLDSRSGWETGGDEGPAVVPGKPEESLLMRMVRWTDEDHRMPPKQKLADGEIALLTEWIGRGAPDPRKAAAMAKKADDWWSLQPLPEKRPPGDIDRFITDKLQKHGLSLARESDRGTLIRRLTYDLHGLPPTPEELAVFVADADPGAYEALVERLLASPRYGERFARLWLDVAHYGESDGFGMDRPRMNAWPYRDYVIQAFNEDKPYARFVSEQLAADALYPDEPALLPALGFVAAGPFNQSALVEQVDGTDCKKIALNLDRDDMVSSVGATFLSVTLHCARCHAHKFDPISQRDYYAMQSVFAGVVRGDREFDTDTARWQERQHWLEVRNRIAAGGTLDSLAAADRQRVESDFAALKERTARLEKAWTLVRPAVSSSGPETAATPLPDGSYRFEGEALEKDSYTLIFAPPFPQIAAVRVEVLADDSLPRRGPGRNPANGNLHLSEAIIEGAKIKQAVADFDQSGWEAKKAIDGKPETAWGINPREGRSHAIVFTLEKPYDGDRLTMLLDQLHGGQHLIGRLRVWVSADPAAVPGDPEVRDSKDASAVAPAVIDEVIAALPAPPKVFAIGSDLPKRRNYYPPKEPYPIHILARGDIHRPGMEARPGGLASVATLAQDFAIGDPTSESQRRAALAEWMVSPKNMLTWRSIANRLWLWHFGRGLVDSPNDFGRMGAEPTHPELLDWLACEFRDSGGSFKHLHRLIVTSAVYRQSSAGHAPPGVDSDNTLLWRQHRRRLDAEQLRDTLLAASGTLDLAMGGPSAMQFNYADPNPNVVPRIDYEGFDPDAPPSFRRGVYRHLFRNVNDALLEAFDAVDPSLSTPRRNETTTPLQALSLFNNRFVLRQCEHLAARLEREAGSPQARIERACLLLWGRAPDAALRDALTSHAEGYGLASACRILVNSNAFLFIE